MIVILSSGNILWQNAFYQLPCLRVHCFSNTKLVIKCIESSQRMGAYLSDLVQMQSS
jgi:hypothetical protein